MFLQIAQGYKINLNTATSVSVDDGQIRFYIPRHGCGECLDDARTVRGIIFDTNIEQAGDMVIAVYDEVKRQALTGWIDSNTI